MECFYSFLSQGGRVEGCVQCLCTGKSLGYGTSLTLTILPDQVGSGDEGAEGLVDFIYTPPQEESPSQIPMLPERKDVMEWAEAEITQKGRFRATVQRKAHERK